MNLKGKRILVLAPHTDDGEFGLGGSIAKFQEDGNEVFYVAFSACRQSVIEGFPPDILITEVKAATKILGIKPSNLFLFDYEVRTFNFHRQSILDDMLNLRQEIRPDVIFMPSPNDLHQDHSTISQEGLRAFKYSSILCYELPWNNLNFTTSAFILLSEENINTKINSLMEYKSQAHRPYSNGEYIRSLARTRAFRSILLSRRHLKCCDGFFNLWKPR
jgi:LmbE family N-acetylglucosaminyl deacetylase